MMRSRMLDILESYTINNKNSREDFDHILKMLEDHGMLPPKYFTKPPHMFGNYAREWEPEDVE